MEKKIASTKQEKEKKVKEQRRLKLTALFFALFLGISIGIFAIFVDTETWVYYFNQPKLEKRSDGELRVHFLDVGQADSTLIEFPDGKTMLVDGGDVDADEKILPYLNALKIKKLDYVLLTHTDSDHCGALDVVLREKEVETVILPFLEGDEAVKNSAFSDFSVALENSDAKTETAYRYLSVTSSNPQYPYTFTVLYPHSDHNEDKADSNAISTVCWLDYLGTSVLLCGDTNSEVLETIMRENSFGVFDEFGVDLESTEIIKLPHHGAEDGLSSTLLDFFNADTGIASCGKNNYYGHPAAETLKLINDANVTLYRTDWVGDIRLSVTADGNRKITTEQKEKNK